ncbi:small nuclear ribonucleoprotein [Candidatus Woesearchaeota archaeon]|nr:MAG: small nuclear ribonucleoprotein [Candidatus Woesearchaeota archaeon]
MENSRPLDALNNARGKRVMVELKNGAHLSGILEAFDIHVNTVLKDAQETRNDTTRNLGTVFIRGDTVVLISPTE